MNPTNKNKIIATAVTSAVLVWGLPLTILGFTNDKVESNDISNKSIITIDNKEIVPYTEYTDRVSLASVSHDSLEDAKIVSNKLDEAIYKKDSEERRVRVANRIAEEKRIAAEKEKARLAELARAAEDKKQLELAQAAEKKRLAELEVKRVAKNKAKEEAKTNKQTEKVVVSRGSNEANVSEAYYEITAYTAGAESTGKSKGDKNYGLTASGAFVQQGITIACPKNFAFGTKIDIEGYGIRVCQDTGSAIGSGKIDLYMDSLSEAKKFGRQTLRVRILN